MRFLSNKFLTFDMTLSMGTCSTFIRHIGTKKRSDLKIINGGIVMKTKSSFSVLIFFVILAIGIALAYASYDAQAKAGAIWIGVISFLVALIISSAIKIANQWEKAVILRLGHFHTLRGPGLFFIIPIIDTVAYWIDIRVITTTFTAEKTLTKDTVPVDVDAVLFWRVLDAEKAALEIAEYKGAINWASQTALRDVIGKTMLSEMLEGRDKMSKRFRR